MTFGKMRFLVPAAALALSLSLRAAEPIVAGERSTLTSKVMGEDRTIFVSTPVGYVGGTARYPVIYLTDAEAQFAHTRATAEFLARNVRMPAAIVVGVTNTDRTRDLTPTRANMTTPEGRVLEMKTSGGADRFLDFFQTELIPWVEANYRTQPYRVFCGHSFGGLFAVHAFLTRPDLFNSVVAVSPTLRWDDRSEVKRAETFFKGRGPLKRTLFVTLGSEGTEAAADLAALVRILQGQKTPGFVWGSSTYPEEDHGSVVLRSHYDGFRKIFDGWLPPRDPVTGDLILGLAATKAHYAKLSDRMGTEVRPPEFLVNLLGYQRLGKDDVAGALEAFRDNAAAHPQSANVYDSLGDALDKSGDLEGALRSYEKAAELGEKASDPNTPAFRKNVERMKEKLKK